MTGPPSPFSIVVVKDRYVARTLVTHIYHKCHRARPPRWSLTLAWEKRDMNTHKRARYVCRGYTRKSDNDHRFFASSFLRNSPPLTSRHGVANSATITVYHDSLWYARLFLHCRFAETGEGWKRSFSGVFLIKPIFSLSHSMPHVLL